VGAAILVREGVSIPTWGIGSSAPTVLRESQPAQLAEASHERKVSDYIGAMSVLWVDIPDDPSPNSQRSFIERNAIALLSNRFAPIDSASSAWLGRLSPKDGIRLSNLWNLNHIDQTYDPSFLDELQTAVQRTNHRLD